MPRKYVHTLTDKIPEHSIGNKAQSLKFLVRHGFQVPRTFVCDSDAFLAAREDLETLQQVLIDELHAVLNPTTAYAVRSSANMEDGLERSFAGQFRSVLNVTGISAVMAGIDAVWASVYSEGVRAYMSRAGLPDQALQMAVLVQEMVKPVVSGVAFSRNPTTGLQETLIEAVSGPGDALVQHGITPQRWRHKWGAWLEQPEKPLLQLDLVNQIVDLTKRVAAVYGQPVDLEWVFNGQEIYWLQMRPLTAVRSLTIYSNRIAREVFPGLIKPLVWSVNIPLVNGAWIRLLRELTGPTDLQTQDLARSFFSRAYFNMSALGDIFEKVGMSRQLLEILMGIQEGGADKPSFRPGPQVLRHFPRMLRFLMDKFMLRRSLPGKIETILGRLRPYQDEELSPLTDEAILERVDRIYALAQELAYYNIVTPLFMLAYTRLLRRGLARLGVDFESYDITGGLPELERFNPVSHLEALHAIYQELPATQRAAVDRDGYTVIHGIPEARTWTRALEDFFDRFGHLSDRGNDFSVPPWREVPDQVLELVRQQKTKTSRGKRLHFEDLDLSRLQHLRLRGLNARARQYRLQREEVSFSYTYGYGLLRRYFLELGERFHRSHLLDSETDIFFLTWDEIKQTLEAGRSTAAAGYQNLVERRRQLLVSHEDMLPPETIYGEEEPPPRILHEKVKVMRGVATSRGYYRGPIRVVRGSHEFHKLQEGDVLVIPYSDVGWTPLFNIAGAVIAESGGILSHSSIVAREYQLPAVVSVDAACSLPDDLSVTVDGYKGEIIIHEDGYG